MYAALDREGTCYQVLKWERREHIHSVPEIGQLLRLRLTCLKVTTVESLFHPMDYVLLKSQGWNRLFWSHKYLLSDYEEARAESETILWKSLGITIWRFRKKRVQALPKILDFPYF